MISLGTLDMTRGGYHAASTSFLKALRRIGSSESSDRRLFATSVSGLATIAAETADLELAKRARSAFEKAEWPASLAAERVCALAAFRTLALLEGDVSAAYFFAREAAALAPSPALSVVAETDSAAVGRILGDLGSERLQLRRAWDILRAPRGLDRDAGYGRALATFAIGAASLMPAEARKAMTTFRSIAPTRAATDPYLQALGAHAASRVAEVSGDRVAAVRSARSALALFSEHGIDLRTALVAVDLRRLTGDDSFAKIARSVVARAPKAWFAAELKRGKSPVFALTPAERVVLARLLRGESAKAIGEALERSPFTISNHTRKIFAAFDLNSRSKVIARCVELGITPESIERES